MARQKRALGTSAIVLIVVGSIGFLNLSQHPRFTAFHAVDVLQLLATGMCYGVALAGILALARGNITE